MNKTEKSIIERSLKLMEDIRQYIISCQMKIGYIIS